MPLRNIDNAGDVADAWYLTDSAVDAYFSTAGNEFRLCVAIEGKHLLAETRSLHILYKVVNDVFEHRPLGNPFLLHETLHKGFPVPNAELPGSLPLSNDE